MITETLSPTPTSSIIPSETCQSVKFIFHNVSTREELRVEAVTIDAQKTTVTFEVRSRYLFYQLSKVGGLKYFERLVERGFGRTTCFTWTSTTRWKLEKMSTRTLAFTRWSHNS